jgi:4-(gamma-glutamylamino)butanal dehydrogenase
VSMVSDPVAAIDWRQRAAEITIDEGIFVGGERRAAINSTTKVLRSARDGSKLVDLAWAQAADADAAVVAARNAFDHGSWPQLHPRDLGRILQDFASLIEQHRHEVDLGTAHRVSRALRVGTVRVSCYEEGNMAVPFGGVRLSGFGRDKSRHALEEYTYFETRWIRYA